MQINIYGKQGEDKPFSYQSLLDRDQLQILQNGFCNVTGTCVYCINTEMEPQTDIYGPERILTLIKSRVFNQLEEQVVLRVAEGSLEEYVVEDTPIEDIKLAAVSVRIEGKAMMTWVVYGIISDEDEGKFYDALDLLRDTSITLFRNKFFRFNAEAESLRCRHAESKMRESLSRTEALTAIVQLLDSDEAIEILMEKVLSSVGSYLDISNAQIFQVMADTGRMDVMHEWLGDNIVSIFEKTKNLESFSFLKTDKPLVLGSGSMVTYEGNKEFYEMHIKATMVFPLMKSGDQASAMYICFNQIRQNRIWKQEEIKFISDAVKVLQNIMTRRLQKTSLTNSYASLKTVLDNISCGICVRDITNGKILLTNKYLKCTFSDELQDGSFYMLLDDSLPEEHKPGIYEMDYSQKERWYDLSLAKISWMDGRPVELYSLYDVSDKKIYHRKIEQQAYTDFLTGLYNRMCCERDLAWHIDDAKKRDLRGSILYLDLDDFKHINDGLGHQYGDVLLKSISGNLRRIEGIRSTCYRMGGDEFVIIIPPESQERFECIIENIKRIFSKPWFLKDADYYCTMSMGVVAFPDDGDNVQDLIKKADIAMYEAKRTGKNRVSFFNADLETGSGRRLDMEKNMRDAAANGFSEFEVYYQPIMDISLPDQLCTGAEALVRWNNEELGFISPMDFIPLAEYLGLITPIGNYVLMEACKACKYWNDHGLPRYKINVNLSVVQLLSSDIVEVIEQTLKETQISPRNLTLEVTESLAINDIECMKEILENIKRLGVRIALDDFGTGYSALSHIRELPFDVIKVDQTFVKDLMEDAYSKSFIKLVTELAATIGANICVEGVEKEEQYKVLEGMKVRMVQGFYFGAPMTRDNFEDIYCRPDQTLPRRFLY